MDSVGVSPCRNVWMQPFLLSLSSFRYRVAASSNLLFKGVCNRCHSVRSIPFSSTVCLIGIGQSYDFSILLCSNVVFQPVLVKYLVAV
jgi:hypothetical protein